MGVLVAGWQRPPDCRRIHPGFFTDAGFAVNPIFSLGDAGTILKRLQCGHKLAAAGSPSRHRGLHGKIWLHKITMPEGLRCGRLHAIVARSRVHRGLIPPCRAWHRIYRGTTLEGPQVLRDHK